MRFLHTADLHLGAAPDWGTPWSDQRALDLWDTFRRIIDIAADQKVDLLLIAGDLFHHQPTLAEAQEVNRLFESIPRTRVVIIAGDRDHITETSPYRVFHWNANVKILSSPEMSSVYLEDLNTEVHGFSYDAPQIREGRYDDLHCPDDGRLHILLAHGGDEDHIPLDIRALANACYDYTALGHLHQPQLASRYPLAFSGSPEPIYPEDTGAHGYILGTLDSTGGRYNWYPCGRYQYQTLNLEVTPDTTLEQLEATLREQLAGNTGNIYRIRLQGSRNPRVSFYASRLKACGQILEIQDETQPSWNPEEMAAEHAQDLISHYMRRLHSEDPTSRKSRALAAGIRALLLSEDGRRSQ